MKLFYMQRGKEEIDAAMCMLPILSDVSIPFLIKHLIKGMGFISDFMNNKHVDLFTELPLARTIIDSKLGKDFLETYYYLNSLTRKEFRVLNKSNIIINGRKIENVDFDFFKNLTFKIVKYFNTVYNLTENGLIWV